MSNAVDAHGGRLYKVVDLSTDSTEVYGGKCRLWGVYVNTVLSAQGCPIKDDTTTVATLVASLAAGSKVEFNGVTFQTNLTVDPDNSATGEILVIYEPCD